MAAPPKLEVVASAAQPSFEEVFEREYAFVWRSLRHLGVPDGAVDDATQDLFVVVHRHFSSYDPARDLRGWLWGIARRVAKDHRRSERRHRRKLALVEGPGPDDRLDEALERDDAAEFVEEFLRRLPMRLREVFVLAEIEGMTAPEISGAVGTKLNTVYSRLRAGRQHFATALERRRLRQQREEADHG